MQGTEVILRCPGCNLEIDAKASGLEPDGTRVVVYACGRCAAEPRKEIRFLDSDGNELTDV